MGGGGSYSKLKVLLRGLEQPCGKFVRRVKAVGVMSLPGLAPDLERASQGFVIAGEGLPVFPGRDDHVGKPKHKSDFSEIKVARKEKDDKIMKVLKENEKEALPISTMFRV